MTDTLSDTIAVPPDAIAADFPRPPRTIVPLKGLPFVALALAFLLFAVLNGSLWALTLAHVASGAAWTVIDLFFGLVLGPILAAMPPRAKLELVTRLMPTMGLLMPTMVIMTLVAGFQLGLVSGVLMVANPYHPWILASFVVVGIMSLVALGVNEPANLAVLFELRKPKPDFELIGRLMQRFVYSAGVLGVMQVSILIIMTRVAS
jgi:hypothetical protein